MGFVSNSSSSSFCIYGIAIDMKDEDDTVEGKANKAGLEVWCPEGYDAYYIGKSTSRCPDDKTMGEFKKEIEEAIRNSFGEYKCAIHSESYYS